MKISTAQKLLDQTKSDYNQIAKEFSDSRARSWNEFEYFKPYLKPQFSIVDLGCGNGRFLDFLEKAYLIHGPNSFNYTGIDNSKNLLISARKKHPEAIFLEGDQLKIPLENNTADLIFSIAAFHHIPSHTLRLNALKEMKRVLKKDGHLVMTVWNLWQKKYLKVILLALFKHLWSLGDFAINDFFIPWGNQKGNSLKIKRYYHAFIPTELLKLLQKAGFEIIESFSVKKGREISFLKSFNFCVIVKKLE